MGGGLTRRHVLAIHDVAPAWMDEVAELRDLISSRTDGPVALLVVPMLHGDPRWPTWARQWLLDAIDGGDEPVLHGCTHMAGSIADERELRGLPSAALRGRIAAGLAATASLGVRPQGLIAPCYALPNVAAAAVAGLGIRWWASRRGVRTADVAVTAPAIGLGGSTRLRRALTPALAPAALRGLRRAGPPVRVDLHPVDVRHPRLRGAVVDMVDEAISHHGRTVRHVDLLPAEARLAPRTASGGAVVVAAV